MEPSGTSTDPITPTKNGIRPQWRIGLQSWDGVWSGRRRVGSAPSLSSTRGVGELGRGGELLASACSSCYAGAGDATSWESLTSAAPEGVEGERTGASSSKTGGEIPK
ncbi:unnamed protein product [Linum trigynum]|uniref:Uncharacterized protein n=1 Tax=Linum trigynum TaxID=586398 RepID=A0AAV2GQI0_9ROSI